MDRKTVYIVLAGIVILLNIILLYIYNMYEYHTINEKKVTC